MSRELSKYIITTGFFDEETDNLKQARKELKKHDMRMKALYPHEKHTYGIYMLIERSDKKKVKKPKKKVDIKNQTSMLTASAT